jgi:hypothetical protein
MLTVEVLAFDDQVVYVLADEDEDLGDGTEAVSAIRAKCRHARSALAPLSTQGVSCDGRRLWGRSALAHGRVALAP